MDVFTMIAALDFSSTSIVESSGRYSTPAGSRGKAEPLGERVSGA